MRICIVGGGTVGSAVGMGLAKLGHEIVFYDVEEQKTRELNKKGFRATTNFEEAIQNTNMSFICVPTPTIRGKICLSHVKDSIKKIANFLKHHDKYYLVVIKSTVLPMTTEKVIIPLIEKISKKKVGKDFGVCVNPEFLTESHKSWTKNRRFARDFFSEDRIVIGESDKKAGNVLVRLYKPLRIPIIRTDLRTAETIKYACNCALACRISYWNEIYYVCKNIGVDSHFVARVAAMDERIGVYGTVHGKAFGGKCLPKDLKAFIAFCKEIGYRPRLLEAVDLINEKIRKEEGIRE